MNADHIVRFNQTDGNTWHAFLLVDQQTENKNIWKRLPQIQELFVESLV